METSSNNSEHRPPQTQQQQGIVSQSEKHEDHCSEENQQRRQDFERKTRDQEVDLHFEKMPPHAACFTAFDQDVTSSCNEPGNKCGLTTTAPAPQQSTFPSSSLSSWTCSDELLFPTKLFYMLNDAHEKGFEQIVSWGHGPSSFNVHQKKAFEEQVLPKYFKMTKYKSFTRQLHNYEFQWIRSGPDKGGYCHKYFSRDGNNVDQLLSRKAIALAQTTNIIGTGNEKEHRRESSSSLPIEGVRRWSAPEVLGSGRQPSSEGGQPKPNGAEVLLPRHSSLSCASLLEPHQHRVELKRSESEPMNFSTYSGGYLLPPLAVPLWRHKSSGLPSLFQQEQSMAYSTSGAGNLYAVNQQDALNPFLTLSKNNLGMLSDSQDSLFAGMSTAVVPTTTPSGSTGLTVGDLSISSMGDLLPQPHQVPSNISGIPNRQSSLQRPPTPGVPTSRLLAGRGSSSAPSSSSPSLPATMMMDRDDVLVNLRQSSMRMSSPPLGPDAAGNDPNPLEKFRTFLLFGKEEEEQTTLPISQSTARSSPDDEMYDDDTAAATTMEPRTIEEMMQDESDRPFR